MKQWVKGLMLGALTVSLMSGSAVQAAGLQWMDATHIFEKDVLNLSKSVQLESKADNAKRFRAPAPKVKEYKVGDVETFWTKNIAQNKFEQTPATLKAIGTNCYIFVENGKNVPDSAIQKVMKTFDEKIYSTNTKTFGSEWKPGVDGDNHITLLMFDIKDGFNGTGGYVAGYFFAGDEFLQSQIPANIDVKSNEREMFYLDINPADPTNDKYMSVVAHEFQHMIHFIHDPKELTWLNEACSQIAPYFCGFGHPGQITSYMQTPDNSLTAWAKEQMLANYGQVYLWNYYILNRFLKTDQLRSTFFAPLVADKAQGSDAFDKALKPFGVDSQKTFIDFAIANFVNDPALDKGQYAYDNTLGRLRLPPTAQIKAFPGQVKDTVYLWSADGIKADLSAAKANLKLTFSGTPASVSGKKSTFIVAAVLSDSRNKITPKITFMQIAATGKGTLDLARGEFDTLQAVVIALAPKGVPNAAYAQAPAVPYQFDLSDAGTVVATRRGRRVEPNRLVADYIVSAEAVSSQDGKVAAVALTNLEGLTYDMGKALQNHLEDGSQDAINSMLEAAQDEDSRESLRPLAKKMAEQLEAWKGQRNPCPENIEEKIQALRSF